MPKNSNIIIVRHGEKPPESDPSPYLSPAGQARAQAYVAYFQNFVLNGSPAGSQPLQFSWLFAAENSQASQRPLLTITPLAQALKLDVNDKHKDKDYAKLAEHILGDKKYDDANLLICWHHGEALELAQALGVNPSQLPAAANWPAKWPGQVFGWYLQLCYDQHGNVIPNQTCCVNECLMYDDNGQNPPLGA